MARPGATHRAAAPSCTPATRDRTGRLHRDVHGRPAACRNPAYSMIPGWRPPPGPGSPGVRRHPACSPAIPEPGSRARRHPGVPAGLPFTPCAVTLDQLHRQGHGPRAAGTTDGDASAPWQSRKTLSAAEEHVSCDPLCFIIDPGPENLNSSAMTGRLTVKGVVERIVGVPGGGNHPGPHGPDYDRECCG